MKLYYSPGACSMAAHILAREINVALDLVKVDLKAHKTEMGTDFYSIAPRGYVPVIQDDKIGTLTENIATQLYVASQKPEAKLVPEQNTKEYIRLIEWLNFISTEFHKGIGKLAFYKPQGEDKANSEARVNRMLKIVEEALAKNEYLNGQFSPADAYFFTVLRWAAMTDLKISDYANITKFQERMSARPSVKAAMAEEGIADTKKAA